MNHPKKNAAEAYLSTLGSARSYHTIKSCLNRVAHVLGAEDYESYDWSRLRRSDWQKVLNSLKAQNSVGSTINLYLNVFRCVAREAWSLDVLPQSVYLKIKAIKGVRYERLPRGRSLPVSDIEKLLDSCNDGTIRGKRDKALICVMVGCGLRRAEAVSLELQNYNPDDRSLTFIGKGNKQRRVFLPDIFKNSIRDWLLIRGYGPGVLFPRIAPGADKNKLIFRKMLASSVYRILQHRVELAQMSKLTPHDLRRTFATQMLQNGCDLLILQKAMGHASVVTTARYDLRGEISREIQCRRLIFK